MNSDSQTIILDAIGELRDDMKTYSKTQAEHGVIISGMKHILYDNGQPGLVSKSTETKNRIDNHLEDHKTAKADRQWLVPVLVSIIPIALAIIAIYK